MASFYLSSGLRQQLRETDRGVCAYCQTNEENSGIPSAHDHITPQSKGGTTSFGNLCQTCRPCNEYKGDSTDAIDPLTGETSVWWSQ